MNDRTRDQTAAAFWQCVRITDKESCWNWGLSVTRSGYAYFRRRYAHRVAYELVKGSIPAEMQIDHMCRNRSCVNPNHLQAVTRKENQENRGINRNNRSGVRGVSWHPASNKWRAHVSHGGRQYHVGCFDSIGVAEAAVIVKRNELFTNNIDDRV